MANTNSPRSARFKGWFFDAVNNRLEYWFNGTKVGHINASGHSITDDSTARMTNGVLTVDGASSATDVRVVRLGSTAAVASDGAAAILPDVQFIAPANLRILSAWRTNQTASDVTKGTATTSASYRRVTLITNTAGTGSGTDIVASLNATASKASRASRAFTIAASTVPAGAMVLASHLTVGAETADGTDMAASVFEMAYDLV
jgi:hypothetical protein